LKIKYLNWKRRRKKYRNREKWWFVANLIT